MALGDKIRIARENSGLTMEELGRKCGTTKQTIYKYETGKVTNIPLDRLEMIATSVGVTAASLMGWEEEKPATEIDDGLVEISKLFSELSPDNRSKLLELARLYLDAQRKNE